MKYLYVILRNDMPSLTHGKQLAMSGHAASLFAHREFGSDSYKEWAGHDGFGYQINLVASYDEIMAAWKTKPEKTSFALLFDPTYSYTVDEEIYSLIPDKTHTMTPVFYPDKKVWKCYRNALVGYYIFGEEEIVKPLVANFKMAGSS